MSLERCLAKLSKISAGTWQLTGVSSSRGTLGTAVGQFAFNGGEAAAIYVEMRAAAPFLSFMLFHPEDMDCISKCFMGYSFPRGSSISQAEEVMLQELGNIILNALNNSVMNALRRSFLPSVPGYAAGGSQAIVEGLGAVSDLNKNYRTVSASLAMRSGELSSSCNLFLLLPEEFAAELEGLVR
ncbi:MAG TPA: hypothetical protein DCZ92_07635 [Elusimicrobia bacterium]|nr:MAG: hypothetical protein A2016_01580 [Elusimicrobia bacterium GWF2_62_30]HBA60677.1 hypothetical protein [Elusimicrobiota bacterium]